MNKILMILAFFSLSLPAIGQEPDLVFLSGSASQIGNIWGMINKKAVREDMDNYFLDKASENGINEEELIRRSQTFINIVENIAPHWLEEARAIADKAGVSPELYISFIANVYRNLII